MELRRLDVFLYKTLYLVAAGIIVFQAFGQAGITSILFLMTFPLTVLLWLRTVRKTATGADLMMLCTAALAVVCVLINAAVSSASLSFDYLRKVIMFIMSLMFLQTVYRVRVKPDIAKFINTTVDCLTVFLILMYVFRYSQMHLFNGRVTIYLTFGFSNPNTTGLFLTCLYMLELYRLFSPEKWYLKILHVMMALFLAVFVLETQARNSLLVLLLFTAVCAWLIFRGRKNMRISKFWATVIAIFPILFVVVYMGLVYSDWFQKVFSFLVGEGKTLNARALIWARVLQQIETSPLIGAYHQLSEGTGMSQMHNTHLDIAGSYGVPVLVLVCILLRKYLYQRGRIYSDKESYIYILSFACAIMLGIGEAALFSGGLGIYLFVGAFLLLSNGVAAERADTL